MTGYFRLILAILVVLGHIGYRFHFQNAYVHPGVISVAMFYLLAGYVVSHLRFSLFSNDMKGLRAFYIERMFRIFPLYYFVLISTVILILITGFGSPEWRVSAMVNNILIIPINYFMVIDSTILTHPDKWLVPTAWSLALELQAYVILGLVLFFERPPVLWALGIASLGIFTLGSLSIINPYYWCYNLIPGVLFLFLGGSSMQQSSRLVKNSFSRLFVPVSWTYILFLISFLSFTGNLTSRPCEVALGYLLGLPIAWYLHFIQIKLPYNKLAGQISYGVFLSHFLFIWVLPYFIPPQYGLTTFTLMVIICSGVFSYLGVVTVENYFWKIRHSIAKANSPHHVPVTSTP